MSLAFFTNSQVNHGFNWLWQFPKCSSRSIEVGEATMLRQLEWCWPWKVEASFCKVTTNNYSRRLREFCLFLSANSITTKCDENCSRSDVLYFQTNLDILFMNLASQQTGSYSCGFVLTDNLVFILIQFLEDLVDVVFRYTKRRIYYFHAGLSRDFRKSQSIGTIIFTTFEDEINRNQIWTISEQSCIGPLAMAWFFIYKIGIWKIDKNTEKYFHSTYLPKLQQGQEKILIWFFRSCCCRGAFFAIDDLQIIS